MFPSQDQNDEEAHDAAAWMERYWMRFFAALRKTASQALRARGIFNTGQFRKAAASRRTPKCFAPSQT
jgi:hypothetical protein